jgi:hypothetical protein
VADAADVVLHEREPRRTALECAIDDGEELQQLASRLDRGHCLAGGPDLDQLEHPRQASCPAVSDDAPGTCGDETARKPQLLRRDGCSAE